MGPPVRTLVFQTHLQHHQRCCPVCTKLLTIPSSYLFHPHNKVLRLKAHRNIDPTALPPSVPAVEVEEIVTWLRGFLRGVVDAVVQRWMCCRRGSEGGEEGG